MANAILNFHFDYLNPSLSFTTSQSPHFPILHFVQNLLHYITFSLEGEFGNVCSRKYQRISITHSHGQHSENHFSESVFNCS